jgi:CheY-like chemotaxis protein
MDLKLPRMTGLEVLEWMKSKAELRELPVFILSSSSEKSDVERAHALGANGYFPKQGTIQGLGEIVRALLAFAGKGGESRITNHESR